jgi:hypothetical protein
VHGIYWPFAALAKFGKQALDEFPMETPFKLIKIPLTGTIRLGKNGIGATACALLSLAGSVWPFTGINHSSEELALFHPDVLRNSYYRQRCMTTLKSTIPLPFQSNNSGSIICSQLRPYLPLSSSP